VGALADDLALARDGELVGEGLGRVLLAPVAAPVMSRNSI